MTDGFQELGLGGELLSTLERLGYARPTAIQRAAIPVLRRGANAVLHAASGAGATAAYGLALAERLRESDASQSIQALVITPTDERAAAVSLELGQLAQPAGVRVGVPAPGWQGAAGIVVVAMPRVLELLQSSTLKLDDLKVLVLHDLSSMLALSQEDALETLMSAVPRDAQRIVITSELTPATEKLAEAHVRKAMHVPARPALRDGSGSPEPNIAIEYHLLRGAPARQAVAEAIRTPQPAVVFCRRQADCDRLREELSLRGLQAETLLYGAALPSGAAAIGYGAPPDAETLASGFPAGGTIILEATQLTHLRNVTKQAGMSVRSAKPRSALEQPGLEQFRASLRRALQEEDVDAQLLVLEPLLAEFSAAEIAAAATALLRKRNPVVAEAGVRPSSTAPSAPPPAFVKLFLSVGSRDAVAAREIVGAITGEAGVSGDQVGRVEVRDTFSIVDVASEVAERVIRALNGTSLRGRSVRVDYDRKTGPPRRSMPARRSHPRQ